MCGEAAARSEVAIALLALGIDALSVSPRAIPELKQRLAAVRLKPLIATAGTLLATRSAAAIEENLRQVMAET